MVGASQKEERFPVHHLVIGMRWSLFDEQASTFASSNLREEYMFAARRACMEKYNELLLKGDDDAGFTGLLNSEIPKVATGVSYVSATTADDIIADLHAKANFASERSKNRFMPDTVAMAPSEHNLFTTKKRSTTTDQTIMQAFRQDNAYISEVQIWPELAGAGPNGENLMLFYKRNNRRAIDRVEVKPFSVLPLERQMFDRIIPAYSSHGGLVTRDPLYNLLAYVQ